MNNDVITQDESVKLEQNFNQPKNLFLERITERLNFFKEREEKYVSVLDQIEVGKDLTSEQFELVGSLCYLVGIDFTNQPYLLKNICDNVFQRFLQFSFSEEFIQSFVYSLNRISETTLQTAKNSLKDKYVSEIKIQSEELTDYNKMRLSIKLIFKNSIVPINMSVGIQEILDKKQLTYDDIIKLNSLINRQCKFVGNKAFKEFVTLVNNKLWNNLIVKASKHFDGQKFAIVYLDGILSVIESNKKFGSHLIEIICANSITIDFEALKTNFEDLQIIDDVLIEKPEVVEEVIENEYKRLPDDVIGNLQENVPFEFVVNVIADLSKTYPQTEEDLIIGFDKIYEQTDFYQNVYHYLKAKMSSLNSTSIRCGFDIQKLLDIITVRLTTNAEQYKILVEKTCAQIPDDSLNKVVAYVNACIKDLILVTDEQKQYLVSQVVENNITTYQHLEQILTLIETCDINGGEIVSYVVLNKFLLSNTDIAETFQISGDIEPLQLKLQWEAGVAEFLRAMLKEVPVEQSTQVLDETTVQE